MSKKTFIPISEPSIGKNEIDLVTRCVESGWVSSLGEYIGEFETQFSSFTEAKYGVSVFNGTVALHLALVALGIKEGDEVIVPSLTFIATANSVLYTGATPIFVDSEMETWNMDPEDIERKITSKTKAIIVVHLYGHPAQMDKIKKIAKKHNLFIIEDAAESHGAEYKGRKVGSIGTVGCFSFYGNKIITTGEGGIAVTNNKKLAESMRFLKDHAMSTTKKYYHPLLGFNYRMTNIQAALGVAQMKSLKKFIERKRDIAMLYNSQLKNISGITLQNEAPWAKAVYWMYSILITPKSGITRDTLALKLKKEGIDSRPFFIPNHQMPYFPSAVRKQKFPVAQKLSQQGINLPSSVLVTDEQIIHICKVIKKILSQYES